MLNFFGLVLFFCIFSAGALSRSPTLSSDVDYYIHNNPSFSFIFSQDFLNLEKDFLYLHKKLTYYDDIYKEVFDSSLSEKPIYIFASSRNQITNASAFSIPFLRVVFFPSGVSAFKMAVDSYSDTVISHEMAHIFQLGQISNKIKYLKPFFRSSEFILIPFPVFLNPNLALSLFFLEGHATLSESLFVKGGRMFSGSTRALVFSQIKNKFQNTNQFIKYYLVNITDDTFTHRQPYAHGAYFFSSLLELYDIKTINSVFRRHAEHFVIPLSFISVKDSFESVFQTSFESLVNHYIQKYLPLAVQQSQSQEKPLFQSRVCPPFNKNKGEVFFLTSDLKSTPVLNKFHIAQQKWEKSRKNFALGKLFKMEEDYYVSSNGYISPVERVYGLFSEGMYLKSTQFKSHKVFDVQNGQVLSMSASNNMRHFRLLLNQKFYDDSHSPALFGPDGGVYYFKQRGYYRVMYRNKAPLFQFPGFDSQPMEISTDGVIYWIAPSLYGSTLFGWTPEEGIYRVSPSDTIISAIKITGNQFLVCEIEPSYYSYKMISAQKIPETPAFYKYPFKKALSSVSTLSNLSSLHLQKTESADQKNAHIQQKDDQEYLQSLKTMDDDSATKESNVQKKSEGSGLMDSQLSLEHKATEDISYSTYNSLWHIRFNGIEFGLFRDPITDFNGLVNMSFRDPMEYSSFKLTAQKAVLLPNWTFKSHYLNRAWRLSWDLQYIYKQGLENFFGEREYTYIHELSQGFSFPLFKVGYWQSSVAVTNAFSAVEVKQAVDGPNWYFITEPSWQIQYKRNYKMGFADHRRFFLKADFHYHLKIEDVKPNFLFKARSHYKFHWGLDFYTKPFFNYKTALKPKSLPFRYFDSLKAFSVSELNFSLRQRVFEQTNDYLSAGLEVEKFITTPLYFSRYPFSIEALAPMVTGTYVRFMNNKAINNQKWTYMSFLEWTFGMSFLILFHHKIKLKLGVSAGFSHPVDWDPFTYPMPSKRTQAVGTQAVGTQAVGTQAVGTQAVGTQVAEQRRSAQAPSQTTGLDQIWNNPGQNWSFGLRLHSRW